MAERKTVVQVISKVDALLSKAQKELGAIVNEEVKRSSPQAYKVGDGVFDDIEKLRWKLRDTYNNLGKRRG